MGSKDTAARRERLVDSLIKRGYIHSPEIIQAMKAVPRHQFMPPSMATHFYADSPQCIQCGQTISAPHMVGIMAERLDLQKGQKILEIGTGSGYHAAIVAHIVGSSGEVHTIERQEKLVDFARQNLERSSYGKQVMVHVGDGSKGWPDAAPYDRIYVTCASPDIPPPLVEQCADGGKVMVPVGGSSYQTLVIGVKRNGKLKRKSFEDCVFVPLVGEHGFKL